MCLHIDRHVAAIHRADYVPPRGTTKAKILRNRRARRAKENMTVYKILERKYGRWLSPYRSFVYEIGKLYVQRNTDIQCASRDALREGQVWEGAFHAYMDERWAIARRERWSDEEVFRCIIPKGALYWTDSEHEIAATKLLVVELILTDKGVKEPC